MKQSEINYLLINITPHIYHSVLDRLRGLRIPKITFYSATRRVIVRRLCRNERNVTDDIDSICVIDVKTHIWTEDKYGYVQYSSTVRVYLGWVSQHSTIQWRCNEILLKYCIIVFKFVFRCNCLWKIRQGRHICRYPLISTQIRYLIEMGLNDTFDRWYIMFHGLVLHTPKTESERDRVTIWYS